MMKALLVSMVAASACILMFGSCATKQSAINKLEKFSYELRDNGEYYTVGDWKDAADKFVRIRRDIQKHDYTAEERRRIGEIEGQCAGYVAKGVKGKVQGLGNEINGILEGTLGTFGRE